MGKEVISQKQAIIVMSAFIIGSSSIVGTGLQAKQDVWLAYLIAATMAALIFPIYARISKLFPEKELSTILSFLFGRVGGKLITLLYTWYAFHLASLVTRNFSEFMSIVLLNKTPSFILSFLAVTLAISAVRGGIELVGRSLSILFLIYIILVVLVSVFSIDLLEFKCLLPVLYDGFRPVLSTSFNVFAFPFAETVIFLSLMGSVRKNSSPYKIYYLSLLIGGILLATVSIRSLLVLGVPNIEIQKFSSYAAVRLINVGDFVQRIEATVAISFIITGFAKTTVCLYAATKGLTSVFNIKDYHKLVAPIGLWVAMFAVFIYDDTTEMFYWARSIYSYYAIPFQIIIPIIIWITAEIKTRAAKAK